MKAIRVLMLCLMVGGCLPTSGMSPTQTMVASPAPQLGASAPSSPFVAQQASASQPAPTPAMSKKTKTVLIVGGVAVGALILILLLSGGNGYSTGDY